MAYYEDMNKYLDLPEGLLMNSLIQIINGKYCIVNGHKGISEYSEERVTIRLKKGMAQVDGVELKISALTATELYISGIIKGIKIDERQ
jgi:sporulation protein YqfC